MIKTYARYPVTYLMIKHLFCHCAGGCYRACVSATGTLTAAAGWSGTRRIAGFSWKKSRGKTNINDQWSCFPGFFSNEGSNINSLLQWTFQIEWSMDWFSTENMQKNHVSSWIFMDPMKKNHENSWKPGGFGIGGLWRATIIKGSRLPLGRSFHRPRPLNQLTSYDMIWHVLRGFWTRILPIFGWFSKTFMVDSRGNWSHQTHSTSITRTWDLPV